jgi:hypothetical protein
VFAELASAQQAALLLARHARNRQGDLPVSVVRLDHQQGGLTEITSMVSMRTLPAPPHYGRRRKAGRRALPPG